MQNAKTAPNVPLGENVRARLQQFSMMNKFKKIALRVVATHLSVEEVSGMKEMFEAMDLNNDGAVSFEELKIGLRKFGHHISDTDVKILMEAVSFVSL